MDTEQFLDILNKDNPGYRDLKRVFTNKALYHNKIIFFTTEDLVRDIPLPNDKETPVFDRKLGVIFLVPCMTHELLLGYLYRYHSEDRDEDKIHNIELWADEYVSTNCGWYITSELSINRKWCAEMSVNYELTAFDKAYLRRVELESIGYCIRTGLQK